MRVFSDGGYTLAERKDFTIHSVHKIHSTESISAEEKFEFVPVSEYDEVWNDSGSGANQDVSVWRPRIPAGCHLIGMTAKNGHSPPNFSTLVIRAGGRDIAPPERFDQYGGRNAVNVASGAGDLSRQRAMCHLAMWGQLAKTPLTQGRGLCCLGLPQPELAALGWADMER